MIIKEFKMEEIETNEIKTEVKYEKEIRNIWEKLLKIKEVPELTENHKKCAFMQDTIYRNSLLFLGVGASNAITKKGKDLSKSCDIRPYNKNTPDEYEIHYEREGGEKEKGEREGGRKNYQYYKPMRKLAKKTGFINWSNIDITLFRETSQKTFECFFKNSELKEIMQEQLDLATRMIKDIKPEIIIASNTLVRKIFKVKIFEKRDKGFKSDVKSEFAFDTSPEVLIKYGTPLISAPKSATGEELKKTPIFFTSMLSGQRALDLGSFERLSWHINYVRGLPKKKNP